MGSTGAGGSSRTSRGASSSPAPVSRSQVKVQNGNTVTLDKPLQYGVKDQNIPDVVRTVIEPWEKIREKSKLEHLLFTDDAGNVISDARGGKTAVAINLTRRQEKLVTTMTHNHPRANNVLGGTFSQADLKAFTNPKLTKLRTLRATAAEGTYSISKGANFNNRGFRKDIIREMNKIDSNFDRVRGKAFKEYIGGKTTWADFKTKELELFNGCLVRIHNTLIANQSKYDYTYTLEPK